MTVSCCHAPAPSFLCHFVASPARCGSTGASEKQDIKWWIARSSRAMTERGKCREMTLRGAGNEINSVMTEKGECRVITVRGAGDDINSVMTEREEYRKITAGESSRIMTVYCVVILSSDCRAKSESPGGFGDFSGDRH